MTRQREVQGVARTRLNANQKDVAERLSKISAEASGAGASGGSTHLMLLKEACLEGFSTSYKLLRSTIEEFDSGNIFEYRDFILSCLEDLCEDLFSLFKSRTSGLKAFGVDTSRFLAQLNDELEQAQVNVTAELKLLTDASNQKNCEDLAELDVKMAVLRIFDREKKAHKLNVIGRPFQSGALEDELGVKFADEERLIAARCVDDLLKLGHLVSTMNDLADPENWLTISESGRTALQCGAMDELDRALHALNPALVILRAGAKGAALSKQPDASRQAAHSGRELITQVLDALAPIDEIKNDPSFQPDPNSANGVTRKMKCRHAIKKRGKGVSGNDLKLLEDSGALLDSLYSKLCGLAHRRGEKKQEDLSSYLMLMDTSLRILLL